MYVWQHSIKTGNAANNLSLYIYIYIYIYMDVMYVCMMCVQVGWMFVCIDTPCRQATLLHVFLYLHVYSTYTCFLQHSSIVYVNVCYIETNPKVVFLRSCVCVVERLSETTEMNRKTDMHRALACAFSDLTCVKSSEPSRPRHLRACMSVCACVCVLGSIASWERFLKTTEIDNEDKSEPTNQQPRNKFKIVWTKSEKK